MAEAVITGVGLMLEGARALDDLLRTGKGVTAAACDPAARVGPRGLRYKDRATGLALAASKEALEHAGLLSDTGLAVPAESVAVIVSSNLGNLDTVCRVVDTITGNTVAATSPMDLPNASSNVVASSVAIWFGLRGVNLMLCNGATSGLDALRWATVLTAARRAHRVLVVGVETTNPVVEQLLWGEAGDSTATRRLLDGAAALVVESRDAALERGATTLAVIAGYARRAGLEAAVAAVSHAMRPGPGVWFIPDGHSEPRRPSQIAGTEGVEARDLGEAFGESSGALGVLQTAAALAWFAPARAATKTAATALLTAGSASDDASAALVIAHAGAGP